MVGNPCSRTLSIRSRWRIFRESSPSVPS